jgi:signal transduction histidine kinase
VHKIVEEHGGVVQVQSEVGRGTIFEMTFPADVGRAHRP